MYKQTLSSIFSHFLIYFDAPPQQIEKIIDECNRDVDIVRLKIYKQNEPIKKECTFHEEMLPPAYRYGFADFFMIYYDLTSNTSMFYLI